MNKLLTKEERERIKTEEQKRKIFIGGLSKITNEETLEKVFTKYGKVEDILINRDIKNHESKGCAFLLFKEETVAKRLINLEKKLKIDGCFVEIKECYEKAKKNDENFLNEETFLKTLFEFQQLFFSNSYLNVVNYKEKFEESFQDNFPQFTPFLSNNYPPEAQNLGRAYLQNDPRINFFNYNGIDYFSPQRRDFQILDHFKEKGAWVREEEDMRREFNNCPVSGILRRNSPKRKEEVCLGKETYKKVVREVKEKKCPFNHRFFNLRFNRQVLCTWGFIKQRMVKRRDG